MKLHIIIMVLPSVYRFRLCSCTYTHSLIVPFCPSLKSLTSDLSRMVFSFQIVHSTLSGLILPKHALLMILFSLLVLVLLLQVIWTLLAYPYKTFPMASLLPAVILFFSAPSGISTSYLLFPCSDILGNQWICAHTAKMILVLDWIHYLANVRLVSVVRKSLSVLIVIQPHQWFYSLQFGRICILNL